MSKLGSGNSTGTFWYFLVLFGTWGGQPIDMKKILINIPTVFSNSKSHRKHIEVHGRPTAAVFRSKPGTHSDQVDRQTDSRQYKAPQSYQLSWSVDSYSPIEEYRLLYRKIKPYHGVGMLTTSTTSTT